MVLSGMTTSSHAGAALRRTTYQPLRVSPPPICTLSYATSLSKRNRTLALHGLGSIKMQRRQQQVPDSDGETLVTKSLTERHQHKLASLLKVGPSSVMATYRWMKILLARLRSDSKSENETADFYAGPRCGPVARKSWFSFAPS